MVKAEMNARLHKIIIAVCHWYACFICMKRNDFKQHLFVFDWCWRARNEICAFFSEAAGKIQPPNMFLENLIMQSSA